MRLLNKLAREASERFHRDFLNSPFDKYYMGYEEGFKKAREMALRMWEREDMTSRTLSMLGEDET